MLKKISGIIILLALLTLTIAKVQAADWYDPNWGQRKIITVQPGQITNGPHAEFPMLVSISSDTDLATKAQPDFDDILFTSSDGTTKLNHEIESYNSGTGDLVAWVNIPAPGIDDGSAIYMYYGNGSTGNQQNATGTWNNNYKGVWHLKEDLAGTGTLNLYQDSTVNNEDGDDYVSDTGKTGRINGGQVFNASSDYIQLDGLEFYENNTAWTFSAWISGVSGTVFSEGTNSSVPFFVIRNAGGALNLSSINSSWVSNLSITSNATDVFDGTWKHIAITDNNGNVEIFINGISDNSNSYTRSGSFSGLYRAAIGAFRRSSTNGFFDGTIDEVHLSSVSRSSGWIQTEWRNQNSTGTFYSIGSEENIFNDAQDGDWNLGATWGNPGNDVEGSGYPGSNDNATIDSHTVTLTGNQSVNDITISNAAGAGTLTAGSNTLNVYSNWNSSTGNFNFNTGTVVIGTNGQTSSITTPDGGSEFNHLQITSGATINAMTDFIMLGALTISDSGTFNIQSNKTVWQYPESGTALTIGSGGTLGGAGTFQQSISSVNGLNSISGTISVATYRMQVFSEAPTAPGRKFTGTTYEGDLEIISRGNSPINIDYAYISGGDLTVNGTLTIQSDLGYTNYTVILYNDENRNITAGNLVIGDAGDTGNRGRFEARSGAIDINGDITIVNASGYNGIDADDSNWTVSGNWINNDTFTAGTSTLTFDGTSGQTITSGGSAFNNLTLDNAGNSFVIDGNLDVDGALIINAGELDLDTNDPDVNTAGSLTINANGSVTKGTGTWTFDGTTDFTDNSSGGPQNLGIIEVD